MNAGASCGYLSLGGHDGIFKVTLAAGTDYSLIGSGTSHNCALDSSGNIECWGANHDGQCSPP
jgi:alpha-tubulin suppressor-like RCC1 family protein